MKPIMLQGFSGEYQAQSNWCWAAVTASIYRYYGAKRETPRAGHNQCVFIRDQIPGVDGCTRVKRFPGGCIQGKCFNLDTRVAEPPDEELKIYGLLRGTINLDGTDQMLNGQTYHGGLDELAIRRDINMGRPIVLRILIADYGDSLVHHALIVIGYYRFPDDRVVIWDPVWGKRDVTPEQITSLYGPVVQIFLTKQASPDDKKVEDPKGNNSETAPKTRSYAV